MTPIGYAERDVEVAEQGLQEARKQVQQAHAAVKHARSLVSRALVAFNAEFPPITRETLMRETIAAEQQHKKDVKAGLVAPQRQSPIANSAIDRTAAYSHGGNADDFARGQMRTGFRRGVTQVRTLPDGRRVRVLIPATTRRGA